MTGKRVGLVAALALLGGCSTNGFSIENVAPPIGREVRAEASVFNFLGLNPTSIERVDQLRDSLREQCDGRAITGLVTLSSTTWVLVGVIEKSRVTGYCVDS